VGSGHTLQSTPGVGFPLLSLTQCSNPGKKNPAAGRIFFANKQMDYL
jgi:hypothetical protein